MTHTPTLYYYSHPRVGLGWLALAVLFFGCSSDGKSEEQRKASAAASSKESTALERAEAVRKLGESESVAQLPTVIDAMNDSAPVVRQAAADAARKIVGAGIRYRPYDKPAVRQQVAETYRRLHALAEKHEKRYQIDLVPVLLDQMADNDVETRRSAGRAVAELFVTHYGFDAEAPESERLAIIARYRGLWNQWNEPDSPFLEWRRHPKKLVEFKAKLLEEIQAKKARGEDWKRSGPAAEEIILRQQEALSKEEEFVSGVGN